MHVYGMNVYVHRLYSRKHTMHKDILEDVERVFFYRRISTIEGFVIRVFICRLCLYEYTQTMHIFSRPVYMQNIF